MYVCIFVCIHMCIYIYICVFVCMGMCIETPGGLGFDAASARSQQIPTPGGC